MDNFTKNQPKQSNLVIYWPFIGGIALVAVFLSWSALSGDEAGRVNLLYLLAIYFALPVLSLLFSIYSWLTSSKLHLGYLLTQLPIFSLNSFAPLKALKKSRIDMIWLLQQSQLVAMVFSLVSILVFLALLMVTDLTFVWRSTLLSPEDIYPILRFLAIPWSFWSDAQPSLELMQAARDYRLAEVSLNTLALSQWWLYILAVQIFYGVMPRSLLFALLQLQIRFKSRNNVRSDNKPGEALSDTNVVQAEYSFLGNVSDQYKIVVWDAIPSAILTQVFNAERLSDDLLFNEWQARDEQIDLIVNSESLIIVVKGWEPPLAELADQLSHSSGYLLLLNWQSDELIPVSSDAMNEWYRFAHKHGWQLLLPREFKHD